MSLEIPAIPPCELCDRTEAMEVAVLMPSFGELVVGNVCMHCWKESAGDIELAGKLVLKRAAVRGVALPVPDQATLFALFRPLPEQR